MGVHWLFGEMKHASKLILLFINTIKTTKQKTTTYLTELKGLTWLPWNPWMRHWHEVMLEVLAIDWKGEVILGEVLQPECIVTKNASYLIRAYP